MFVNTHFNLGKKVIEKLNQKLSPSEVMAFLSGVVYADIGRFKFDKETGVDSDSYIFVEQMKKLAETFEEKLFAVGAAIHVFQDNETKRFLKETLNHDYSLCSNYVNDCGILDGYFAKKSGIFYNEFLDKFNFEQIVSGIGTKALSRMFGVAEDRINDFSMFDIKKQSEHLKKNNLPMYDGLIQRTYRALGFEISLDEIHEQAGNLLGVSIIILAIIGNKKDVSEELSLKIEEKSDEIADLCRFKFTEEAKL